MNNYKIIQDEEKLREFIDWLPELQKGEIYYVALLARGKYAPNCGLKQDKSNLKRFTSTKEYLFSKIKQLECEVGSYLTDGLPMPQEALALYITPNPRSLEEAAKESLRLLANLVTEPYNGYNPHQKVMSEIQKASGTKRFLDFDFDKVELLPVLDQLIGIGDKINENALHVVKTHGGFHILVELDNVQGKYKNSWYKAITSIKGCDVRGDNLLPVIGCTQGNFTPHFVR